MRRIAVINQKGGVGKTTTAVNLGAALARAGKRVLLIDLDPQGHLGLHLGVDLGEEQATVYDVLTDEMPLADVIVQAGKNLDLAPSNIDLAAAESELVSVLGREVLLRDAIEPLEAKYDYLLIDCPPSLGVLTINALVAARELLIPLQAQFFALQGFSKLLDKTVRLVCQRINPALQVLGVALCMHETNTRLSAEVADDIRDFLAASRDTPVAWAGARVFDTFVRRNIKLAEASSFGQSVFDYAPTSNGAIDYRNLAAEIFGDGLLPKSERPTVTPAAENTQTLEETASVKRPRKKRAPRKKVQADAASTAPVQTEPVIAPEPIQTPPPAVADTPLPQAEPEPEKAAPAIVPKADSNGSLKKKPAPRKRATKKTAAAPTNGKAPARRVPKAKTTETVIAESKVTPPPQPAELDGSSSEEETQATLSGESDRVPEAPPSVAAVDVFDTAAATTDTVDV